MRPEAASGFVVSPRIEALTERALAYLEIGYPVHFAGFAGTGKTTMALHLAAKRARPVMLLHGDEELASSDLVGRQAGYQRSKLVDNYIGSVVRAEEKARVIWNESRLTAACREGYTFIYDEFNRSRPEANNILLSVLEERILSVPALHNRDGYIDVHPEFRAIFTSNPEEYAGAHRTPDALLDRLITIHVDHYDRDTEVDIAAARGISRKDAETVVDIVREMRALDPNGRRPSVRAAIAVAGILARRGARARPEEPLFRWACQDAIDVETAKVRKGGESVGRAEIDAVIERVCSRHRAGGRGLSARHRKKRR